MFCFIKPNFDAKIKVDDNFYNVDKNNVLPLPPKYNKITVFGTHTHYAFFVPFVLEEKFYNKFIYKNQFEMLELSENLFLKQKSKINLLNTSYSVDFLQKGKCFVRIKLNEQIFIEQFKTLCHSPQIFENSNFICVYAKNFCDGFCVIVFNKNTNKFCFNLPIYNITFENNNMCLLDYPLSINTAKTSIFNLDQSEIKLIENYYVQIADFKNINNSTPLYFFDAVKSKNYNLSKTMLTQNMQTIATNQMLNDFFLNYTRIEKNPFSENNSDYLIFSENSVEPISFTLNDQLLIDNINKI